MDKMPCTISSHEMNRRQLMVYAKTALTNAMSSFIDENGLTPLEWVSVLQDTIARVVGYGLYEQWSLDEELGENQQKIVSSRQEKEPQ